MEIKNTGSLHALDIHGFILNPCIYPVAQKEYAGVVDWLLSTCQLYPANLLHSIYLRGSVAKGQAIPFISDIDMVVITHYPLTVKEREPLIALKETINTIFPFVTKAEIIIEPLAQTEKTWLKFLLKTQCVCLFGTNLIPSIESFKPGKDACIHSPQIVKQIMDLEEEFKILDDPQEIKEACVWIMKAIVRAGFELVMERDCSYTRDLYPNYERFSVYFPEKEADMRHVLSLAIEPTPDKKIIYEVLKNMKAFMVAQTQYVPG